MASKVRLFGDDTALSAILASDDPREQKRPGSQVRHFAPELRQDEAVVLRGNLAKFSENEEIRVALKPPVPAASLKLALKIKRGASIGLHLTYVLPPLLRGADSTSKVKL